MNFSRTQVLCVRGLLCLIKSHCTSLITVPPPSPSLCPTMPKGIKIYSHWLDPQCNACLRISPPDYLVPTKRRHVQQFCSTVNVFCLPWPDVWGFFPLERLVPHPPPQIDWLERLFSTVSPHDCQFAPMISGVWGFFPLQWVVHHASQLNEKWIFLHCVPSWVSSGPPDQVCWAGPNHPTGSTPDQCHHATYMICTLCMYYYVICARDCKKVVVSTRLTQPVAIWTWPKPPCKIYDLHALHLQCNIFAWLQKYWYWLTCSDSCKQK